MEQINNIPQQPNNVPQPGIEKCTASLVIGIVSLSLVWVTWFSFIILIMAIIAIVLGVKGRKACPVGASGRGMATAGLVLGIIGTVLSSVISLCWLLWAVVYAVSSAGLHWLAYYY